MGEEPSNQWGGNHPSQGEDFAVDTDWRVLQSTERTLQGGGLLWSTRAV